jgi:hypothetical protein
MSGHASNAPAGAAGDEVDGAAAACILGVSEVLLDGWAQQLGFPVQHGVPGAPRYLRAEVEALCAALPAAHSVEGAVQAARRSLGCD